jgi:hypothetical protein
MRGPSGFGGRFFLSDGTVTNTRRQCERWTGRSIKQRTVLAAILRRSIIP